MGKKLVFVLPWLVALIFAGLYLSATRPTPHTTQPGTPTSQTTPTEPNSSRQNLVLVTRVIDGDTVETEGGTRVRYIGIDTPESDDCFGPQAAKANKNLVENKKVRIEKDIQEKDRYQRLLAYVWVGDKMVNEELVAQGFAQVSTFPPNVRYTQRFLDAQKKAREQQLGLWAPHTCTTATSASTSGVEPQIQGLQSDCLIKGNISSSGEKIYHMPGQRYWEKTKIEESRGERWFCTEEEAVSAGWRKSKV